MRTLSIATAEELRRADKAVIAWERYMREVESAASSTIRRRLAAALSSLYKHLVFRSNQMIHSPRLRPRQAAEWTVSAVNHVFDPEH
jgi:hypothetical protein